MSKSYYAGWTGSFDIDDAGYVDGLTYENLLIEAIDRRHREDPYLLLRYAMERLYDRSKRDRAQKT